MKRKIVLIASLACGLLAAILTSVYIKTRVSVIEKERQRIRDKFGEIDVVALKKDTPSGTVFSERDYDIVRAPAIGLRGHAVTRDEVKSVLGQKLSIGRRKGEVLYWTDIDGRNPNGRGLSNDIKRSMRAISINCSGAASVSCMVNPNDHVDVIGTFAFPEPNGKINKGDIVTCTILQNVLVLATGKETSKTRTVGAFNPQGYSTVTLEVTPREAEMLAFAEQMKGRLILTLRNRSDTTNEKELPKVDFEKIKGEIEELNLKRQSKMGGR